MHLQIHAKRFADDPEERKQVPFNSQPAMVSLKDSTVELVIDARNEVVAVTIDGKPQMPIALGEWEYTAIALVFGDPVDVELPEGA